MVKVYFVKWLWSISPPGVYKIKTQFLNKLPGAKSMIYGVSSQMINQQVK